MKANKDYINLSQEFWANIKYLSQEIGYSNRNSLEVKAPSANEIKEVLKREGLDISFFFNKNDQPTDFGETLLGYFKYRADILNHYVEPRLMVLERAKDTFEYFYEKFKPGCPIPMNKQTGEKKSPAYFSGLINMIIEANSGNFSCDYDPMKLTVFTRNNRIIRTFSRRVDGAFPATLNPVAIWEIKEYYFTTTFGSRVADGIYETLLDGMELMELRENQKINCKHYLMVDSHFVWWNLGRSYLCRIIDLLHMGYIDEVLFGYEVVEQLPTIVKGWVEDINAPSSN